MTSGDIHDRHILKLSRLTPGVAVLWGYTLFTQGVSPWGSVCGATLVQLTFSWAGLCLSPDLDTVSNPYYRWGAMRWIWVPYQKVMPHRGISHWLLVGSLTRLLYLAIALGLILVVKVAILLGLLSLLFALVDGVMGPGSPGSILDAYWSGVWQGITQDLPGVLTGGMPRVLPHLIPLALSVWAGAELAAWVHLFGDAFLDQAGHWKGVKAHNKQGNKQGKGRAR